ncbi:MAG: GTPase HflX [Deltaproteobacteria bacterium]|nr:GTPase HflX [Deltaproteobacteria bacterium]
MSTTELPQTKALLVSVASSGVTPEAQAESLEELGELAASLGWQVVCRQTQSVARINPATYMGSGKVDQVKALVGQFQADVVVFDNNLSPSQGENLEKAFQVMVMDRTQLILEIFHKNARTHEARLQVELAQLEYMLPRLVGLWAHLDRERGGIAGSKGTGEKQINIDRSMIRRRIARLKKDLEHVSRERSTQKKRRAGGSLRVSVVGYTNAGKSTLMNRLTGAGVRAENRLFATLDSTTRVMASESRPPVLLSDTVGFIKHLPHQLVASFRSTLEVVADADLLLHLVDISHDDYETHIHTTESVLESIGVLTIPRLLVFNKVDRVEDKMRLLLARQTYPDALLISALTDDMEPLRERVTAFFQQRMMTRRLELALEDADGLSEVHRLGRVERCLYHPDRVEVIATLTPENLGRLRSHVALRADDPAREEDQLPQTHTSPLAS